MLAKTVKEDLNVPQDQLDAEDKVSSKKDTATSDSVTENDLKQEEQLFCTENLSLNDTLADSHSPNSGATSPEQDEQVGDDKKAAADNATSQFAASSKGDESITVDIIKQIPKNMDEYSTKGDEQQKESGPPPPPANDESITVDIVEHDEEAPKFEAGSSSETPTKDTGTAEAGDEKEAGIEAVTAEAQQKESGPPPLPANDESITVDIIPQIPKNMDKHSTKGEEQQK
jgi:hypothetical protein